MPIEDRDIEAIALLDEPVRRRLYEWVIGRGGSVSRDEAAAGVEISRSLAAFHLDRLADEGLLEVDYGRRSGRTGPGAGRPAKLYRRAARDIAVSLPERRYERAAAMMAEALEASGSAGTNPALSASARAAGLAVGSAVRRAAGTRPGKRRRREGLVGALRERGYEPQEASTGDITLGNCPYHALVQDHRDLVCGMNLAWAEGVLDGVGDLAARARLDPQPHRCCVVIGGPAGG